MKIAMLVIGNEVLQGKIQDSNSKELASSLLTVGKNLSSIITIPDEIELIVSTLKQMTNEFNIIFTSGGLGPTLDDVTKVALAKLVNSPLVFNQIAHEIVSANYRRHDRTYQEKTQTYHLLPTNCSALNNPTGFAPGLKTQFNNAFIYSLPGVPHEFQSILKHEILPTLQDSPIVAFTIKTARIPESQIFNQLCPNLWQTLEQFGSVSSLPHFFGVDIGVLLKGSSQEIEQQKNQIIQIINSSPLKQYLIDYSDSPRDLAEIIVEKCLKQNIKIGFAESCTGGLNSDRITNIPGSSDIFMGSVICYSNQVKQNLLGVKTETLAQFGAVSVQCAEEMAHGLLKNLQLDFAIATTGIAGPGGGNREKPVGTVAVAIASKHSIKSELLQLKGNRLILKQRFSQASLLALFEAINS
jgi:nicotinamide-nucleotide amidase